MNKNEEWRFVFRTLFPRIDKSSSPLSIRRSRGRREMSHRSGSGRGCLGTAAVLLWLSMTLVYAQDHTPGTAEGHDARPSVAVDRMPTPGTMGPVTLEPNERERLLLARINQLEQRLAALESFMAANFTQNAAAPSKAQPVALQTPANPPPAAPRTPAANADERAALEFFRDTTINLTLDGYYGYNFNRPVGRINLLRAYDVLSNSFSLNQATLVLERAPNIAAGRRYGARVDLQYGQATETLQGSAANEPRPQVYRPIFQAYGTYVVPVGNGLTVDFGKWASALGFENNYTKDQFNYSRSYFFNYLPFYHFGFRAGYDVSPKLNATYWLVNGRQQSEAFNGFKSQAILLNVKPTKAVSWNLNYYVGAENLDTRLALNPGVPDLPTQPGLSPVPIRPRPNGLLHILDTYAAWKITDKLTVVGEADYVVQRERRHSAPAYLTGGAAYVRYQFTPKFSLNGRGEYLSDRGKLFSGASQALKETTLTADYIIADGFMVHGEFRRDFSNQPFFLTAEPGILKKEQNTVTLGLMWWLGRKQGTW